MVKLRRTMGGRKMAVENIPAKDVKIRVIDLKKRGKRYQAHGMKDGKKYFSFVSKENADRIKKGLEPK